MARLPLRSESQAMSTLSVIVIGLMVALGIIVLAAAAAARHIDRNWRDALVNRWTVELGPSDHARPADQADIAANLMILRAIPGIASATSIEPDEIRALIKPWLRDPDLIGALPLPILIDLELDPNFKSGSSMIADQIKAKLPDAKLDDHSGWTHDLMRIARAIEMLGVALFVAIALTTTASIAATARARLAVNRGEIALLHAIGATDRYIVRQFQAGAFRSAAIGAFLGIVVAGTALGSLMRWGPTSLPFLTQFHLDGIDWTALACVPIGAMALATLVAGLSALSAVRRLL